MLAVAGLLVVACGTAPPNSGPGLTPSASLTTDYGQQYLTLIAPVNSAGDQAKQSLNAFGSTFTGADVAKAVAPYVTALQTFNSAVIRVSWPAKVEPDIRALVAADAVVIGDLNGASTLTALNASQWVQQLNVDASKSRTASDVVRADLGLPASSSTP